VPKRASDKDALRAFGAAVRELRTERNMSVSELANGAETTTRRIDRLETGRLDPPFDLMLAVADALGVRVSTIVRRASTHEQRED
jgi:XRE family transcriptional regulator, regulator of sulfur utilization